MVSKRGCDPNLNALYRLSRPTLGAITLEVTGLCEPQALSLITIHLRASSPYVLQTKAAREQCAIVSLVYYFVIR